MDLGTGLELIRPWLSTGGIVGILAIAVKLYIDNQKLKMDAKARYQDFQLEVSEDGRTNLQFIIDNLVRDITAQRQAHEQCQTALENERDARRAQGKKLDGLERQFINYQLVVARAIPPNERTPAIQDMLAQLAELAAARTSQDEGAGGSASSA